MKLTKDRQLGIVCLLITAFIVWQCGEINIRRAEFEVVGPRTFPMMAAALFAICGIYFLLHKQQGEDKVYMTWMQFGRAMLMFGCYVLYLALLYFVGLKIAAPVATVAMSLLFGKGKSPWWVSVIFGVVFGVAFYLIYVYALQIRVPTGIL